MNKKQIWLLLIIILGMLIILNLSLGEYEISFLNSLQALFSQGTEQDINIILNVRLPRTIGAITVGTTLALSGYYMRYALRNPLADSSILGVQTGATTLTLVVLLYFPLMYYLIPIVAFIGGIIALCLTIIITGLKKLNSNSLILSGVIVNSFFSALIGILTILNPIKLQGALNYLNGSLTGVSTNDAAVMLVITLILVVMSFILIPLLKVLLLDDRTIISLGKSPNRYRLIAATFAVLLASITVAYVGVIAFVGIIIPTLAQRLTNNSIKDELITTILLGSILVIGSDLMQRVLFAPIEIPVGLIIGLGCAPLFLIILRRNDEAN